MKFLIIIFLNVLFSLQLFAAPASGVGKVGAEKDVRKEDGMDAVYQAVNNDILSQIQTGVVNYTDKRWAEEVARQLGYQWDSKTGRVISVRERDASKLSDALYHGFATTTIGSKEVTESDQFDELVTETVY